MVTIRNGYIAHSRRSSKLRYRNWFRGTCCTMSNTTQIKLGTLIVPKEYRGKKLRFKVEILEGELN